MKKKFAMVLMGNYQEGDEISFESERMITYIKTVKNFEEMKKLTLELYKDGVGAIETCGAFTEEHIDELMELTDNKIGIARVVSVGKQKELMDAFFMS